MRRFHIYFLVLISCVTLVSCKTSGRSSSLDLSRTPAAQVSTLLDNEKVREASVVVVREEAFFQENYGNAGVKKVLDRLTVALEETYLPNITAVMDSIEAIKWPQPVKQWQDVRSDLDRVQAELDAMLGASDFKNEEYFPHSFEQALETLAQAQSGKKLASGIFKYEMYRPTAYKQAVALLKQKQQAIADNAPEQFAKYPLGSMESFFTLYPVPVDRKKVLAMTEEFWIETLSKNSDEQTELFMAKYGAYMPEKVKEAYAERYFLSLCPNPKKASIQEILDAYEKCQMAGLPLKQIPGIKIGFLQVTNPKLLQDKAIDFAINVKVDVPFTADRASMRKMFSHEVVKEADILVLMSVAMSRARRVVDRRATLRSTYVASYVNGANPEYDIVRAEVQSASEQFHSAQSRGSAPWPISILGASKEERVASTGERLDGLKEKLRKTPQFVQVPDYQPYNVIKAHMDLYKFATVNYYIVDKRNNTLFQDTFDVRDKASFTVCYDLKQSDPNREKFLQTSVLEEDVARHELTPVVVNLSDLLAQFMAMPEKHERYATLGSVQRAIVKNRNIARKQYESEKFTYDKYADKRFDSVVIVRNFGLGIGTGFYVTENLVLTNYHVVEENEYVRLGLFDKQDTIGRVIARDMYSDLALIQADIKKKPVCFFDKNTIPTGVTLEAIGHPVKYEFSITRGTLSAVRESVPVNLKGMTDRKILYIQTDASINGGNSGGPLFYGDYVVGVNDWSRKGYGKGRSAEGLHFAIHYSEVFKFLEQHGVKVCKGRP